MNGFEAEELATNYLRTKNLKILERNYRITEGEIDIIGKDKNTLVFVEVKYLKNSSQFYPEEQVSPSKQKKLYKAALSYLQRKKLNCLCRFDVLSIEGDQNNLKYHHLEDALEFNF